MKLHVFRDHVVTDPPSKGFVMLPESDADKYFAVELSDLPICERARTIEEKSAGCCSRVFMRSIKQHFQEFGYTTPADSSRPPADHQYVQELLEETSKAWGINAQIILDKAFYIRMAER